MYWYILRSTAVVVELIVIISKIMYIMMVDASLAAGWPENTDPQGCALAEPGGPWHPTIALGQPENLKFFIQIICWAP